MTESAMDCAEIRTILLAGSVPAGSAVDAHVRDCAPCSELLRDHAALGRELSRREPLESDGASRRSSVDPPPEMASWASLEGAIAAESGPRAWLRSRSTPVRVLVALATGALIVGIGGQSATAFAPKSQAVPWLVVFTLAGLASLWVLVAPLGRPQPGSRTRAGLVGLSLLLPLAYALVPSSTPGAPPTELTFAEQALACFVYGSVLALPFLVVVWTLDRSDHPSLVLLIGLAGLAGLVANAALALHCSNTAPLHLAAGHATIGGALAGIGALVAMVSVARRKSAS